MYCTCAGRAGLELLYQSAAPALQTAAVPLWSGPKLPSAGCCREAGPGNGSLMVAQQVQIQENTNSETTLNCSIEMPRCSEFLKRLHDKRSKMITEKPHVCVSFTNSPTSNSNPLFWKVCVHPPAWSCCSRTTTFFPALDKSAAAVKPPMPLPITTASRSAGTRSSRNPVRKHLSNELMEEWCEDKRTLWMAGFCWRLMPALLINQNTAQHQQ